MTNSESSGDPDQPVAASKNKNSDKKNKFVEVPSRLASKLRQIRINSNLTQGKMLLIVSPRQNSEGNRPRIAQYEKGKRVPSLIEIWRYAKFYGVTMEDLVDDTVDLPVR